MRTHPGRTSQRRLRNGNYVTPQRLSPKYDSWGQRIPGQWDRNPLPEALFSPGASEEAQRLSDATLSKAELFWRERVEVTAADQIEIPDFGIWHVNGEPAHWGRGTTARLEKG